VATVAATVSPTVASATAGALIAASAVCLGALRTTAPVPSRARRPGQGRPDRGSGLLSGGFMVLVAVNLGIGVFFGSMQVGVTAFALAYHLGGSAGLLYAAMSTASLIGGLLYGHRHWRVDSAAALPRALWLLTALAVPLVLADSPVALTVAQLAPGLVLSPALILSSTLVSRGVHRDVRTQAFTWINSASAAGIAAAAALTGYLTDTLGSRPVFAVAVTGLLLSAVTATITIRPLSSDTPPGGSPSRP